MAAHQPLKDRIHSLMECGICMNRNELQILPCLHRVCQKCVSEMSTRGGNADMVCPFCSASLAKRTDQYATCRVITYFQKHGESLVMSLKQATERVCLSTDCDSEGGEICRSCKKQLCLRCAQKTRCSKDGRRHDLVNPIGYSQKAKEKLNKMKKNSQAAILALDQQKEAIVQKVNDSAKLLAAAPEDRIEEQTTSTIAVFSQSRSELHTISDKLCIEKTTLQFITSLTEEASDVELAVVVDMLQMCDMSRKAMLGDCQVLYEGVKCYDVAWSSKGHLVIASDNGLTIMDVQEPTTPKIIKSVAIGHHVFSFAIYDAKIFIGVSMDAASSRTEMVIYSESYEEIGRWAAASFPIDFAVVDDKVIFSTMRASDLKVFSLTGDSLPDILWNGSSSGIRGMSPDSIVLSDGDNNTVYRKQICGKKSGIVWSVSMLRPWGMCVDEERSVWVRSNDDDCVVIISNQGRKLQEIRDERFRKLERWLGILFKDDHLYAAHQNGVCRFKVTYQLE